MLSFRKATGVEVLRLSSTATWCHRALSVLSTLSQPLMASLVLSIASSNVLPWLIQPTSSGTWTTCPRYSGSCMMMTLNFKGRLLEEVHRRNPRLLYSRRIRKPPSRVNSFGEPDKFAAGPDLGNRLPSERYPNGFGSGFPGKLYTRGEAEGAIADADFIIENCRRHLPRQR